MKSLLLMSGTDEDNGDYTALKNATKSRGRQIARWSTLKNAKAGDEVWFYVPAPASAIVARGVALEDARPDHNWPYVMGVGDLTWLTQPIELTDLRNLFPQWAWTKNARSRTYLLPEYAAHFRSQLRRQ